MISKYNLWLAQHEVWNHINRLFLSFLSTFLHIVGVHCQKLNYITSPDEYVLLHMFIWCNSMIDFCCECAVFRASVHFFSSTDNFWSLLFALGPTWSCLHILQITPMQHKFVCKPWPCHGLPHWWRWYTKKHLIPEWASFKVSDMGNFNWKTSVFTNLAIFTGVKILNNFCSEGLYWRYQQSVPW